MDTERLAYWLILNSLQGIGPIQAQALLSKFNSISELFSADRHSLSQAGLTAESIEAIRLPDWKAIEADLKWLEQEQSHILALEDKAYPEVLRQISDPPLLLYVRGDPEALSRPQLAMVGSRNPTPAGRSTAFEFAEFLASTGLVITSGLAIGIDAASHTGALKAHGQTLAVLGTGIDRIYPLKHQELADRIAGQGALISEFSLGCPPLRHHFPRRNRIISGLSHGVLVVEAANRSGSLITAQQALEQNREVFAIPGSIHNPNARGCNNLIRQGAKLVESVEDIFDELEYVHIGNLKEIAAPKQNHKNVLDSDYKNVVDQMGFEPVHLDELVIRCGLTPEAVCSILLQLELQGYIYTDASGRYCRNG